eukprot:356949-Chlamydomonas_euryale.AAC.8
MSPHPTHSPVQAPHHHHHVHCPTYTKPPCPMLVRPALSWSASPLTHPPPTHAVTPPCSCPVCTQVVSPTFPEPLAPNATNITAGELVNLRVFNPMLTFCHVRGGSNQIWCGVQQVQATTFIIEAWGKPYGVQIDFATDYVYLRTTGSGSYCSFCAVSFPHLPRSHALSPSYLISRVHPPPPHTHTHMHSPPHHHPIRPPTRLPTCRPKGSSSSTYIFCDSPAAISAFQMPFSHKYPVQLTNAQSRMLCGADFIPPRGFKSEASCMGTNETWSNYYTDIVFAAEDPAGGNGTLCSNCTYAMLGYDTLYHYQVRDASGCWGGLCYKRSPPQQHIAVWMGERARGVWVQCTVSPTGDARSCLLSAGAAGCRLEARHGMGGVADLRRGMACKGVPI